MLIVDVLVSHTGLTPANLKPLNIFQFSGTDVFKLPSWRKYTSGPAEFPPDRW
jgi:hypothetical protein